MDLYHAVQQAKNKDEVVQAVRQWVDIECVHLDHRTLREQTAQNIASTICGDMHWLAELIEAAKRDPDIWEGLRRYALEQSQEGQSINPDLTILVSNGPPKRRGGRPEGRTPFKATIGMVYARAVWCVYHGSAGRYTLSNSSPNPDNAYEVVAEATGESFDHVRNVARKKELSLLTQLYRHAEKNHLNWHPGHSRNTDTKSQG